MGESTGRAAHGSRVLRYLTPAALFLILLFVTAVRLRLSAMPLERDEGEYAYGGRLLLEGTPPYQQAYFMKLPGVHLAYAAMIALFGQTATGVHRGFLLVNLATILLVFQLGRKLLGSVGGLAACAIYAFMSLSPAVLGFAAHATHFVVLCALAGIVVLLRATESGRLVEFFLAGLLCGLAVLMKQPGAFFMLFALAVILLANAGRRPFPWRATFTRAAVFSAGGLLPFGLTCLWLWRAGVFNQFWFFTVTLVRSYGTTNSLALGLRMLRLYITVALGYDAVFWILGGVSLVALLLDRHGGRARPFVAGLLLTSVVAAGQGLYFRPHYFVLVLPALALTIAAALGSAHRWMAEWPRPARAFPAAVLAAALAGLLWQRREMFFELTPDEAVRKTYPGHPFCESIEVARYLREHTAPDNRIAVLGSEPQIYFYARRPSGTAYIYTFEMMEQNPLATTMQKDMIQQIEATQPEFLVIVKSITSWANMPTSNHLIFNWADDYWAKHYDVEGVVDFPYPKPSKYYWGADAAHHVKGESQCLYILRKKRETATATAGHPN